MTTSVHLDSGINAIATNREKTQVAAAGRLVFKIFHIEEGSFREYLDLRVGRINLNYSCNDVVWNSVRDDILATGATNGAVVTWNLGISKGNKMDKVFTDNTRTVNKVCFHPSEWNILLSGSSGGVIRYFDLRNNVCASTFSGTKNSSGSIRDIQFSPHQMFIFASATDDGYVQFWDYRRNDRVLLQELVHQNIVFSLDWHPEERNWLATSGRDKTIKIWHQESHELKLHLDYTLYHIQSVRKVKWRPERKYHIASCSQVDDNAVSVWDIRRPYVPFAVFEEHKEAPTGITWYDQNIFLTSGKDGVIYQHVFKDAKKPAETSNPVGVSMSLNGDIFHIAVQSGRNSGVRGLSTSDGPSAKRPMPMFFRRHDRTAESFVTYESRLIFHELRENRFSEWFCETAKQYQLVGKPFGELCEENAKVAEELGRHQVAQTWHLLRLFFVDVSQVVPKVYSKQSSAGSTDVTSPRTQAEPDKDPDSNSIHRDTAMNQHSLQDVGHAPDSTTGVTDEESDSDIDRTKWRNKNLQMDGIEDPFTLDDDDNYDENFDLLDLNLANSDNWNLPAEAFPHRHEIENIGRQSSPDPTHDRSRPSSPPTKPVDDDQENSHNHQLLASQAIDQAITKHRSEFNLTIKYRPLIKDMLSYYADKGDVQMSVSAYVVLGDKIKGEIPSETIEHWFISYIELLSRFKLWPIANHVIKCSDHPNIQMLNQQSTTIYANCNNCDKPLEKKSWACNRCGKLTNTCSVCHLPVKGLYSWCQGCSHGGHMGHLKEWFSRSTQCPTGCGHECELR